ncbi:mono/diheme cytochrome c family protein [Rhodovulum iodosum]|uniref:Mono/diheme cytochrome c family protein n=1 Tax=Rhodovulum iodosum TaxID=68291 RepID=A0ABV3XVC2_9RHOB|nr:diheme cytochrome c [Rhodovulum robiginosum]RSK30668.1 cytochrome C [Rhodovulum robiginosum]
MTRFSAALALALAASPALADDDYIPPVTHAATQEECGACHMAYQPGLLPARSWSAIMGDLANHFGENADLDEATRAEIEAYLVSGAARRTRSIPADETPLRISELPWFKHEHDHEVSQRMRDRAKTMSNCVACHRGADRGYYEDD